MQWRERRFKVSRNLQGAVNEHLLCKTCSVSTQIRLFNLSKAVTFVLLNIQRRWQRFTVTRVTKPAVTLEALSGICFNCSLTLVRLIFIALGLRLWPLSTTWLPFHLEDSDLNLSFFSLFSFPAFMKGNSAFETFFPFGSDDIFIDLLTAAADSGCRSPAHLVEEDGSLKVQCFKPMVRIQFLG